MEETKSEQIVEKEYYYEIGENYLYFKFTEPETLESCKLEAIATIQLLKKYGLRKVITDNSLKTSFLKTFDEYELTKFYEEEKFYRHISSAAVVFSPDNIDQMKFWQTASRNRGLNVKIFSNIEDAELWIKDN